MGLDQAIKRMSPEIADKLTRWQELGQDDEEYLSDAEYATIEELWRGRKENHIRLAVERVSGREPVNCGYVLLTHERMEKLVGLLTVVNRDKDPETAKLLLPTQGGFFFGSTEYDEYYFEDIERELEAFAAILKEWDESKVYAYWEWW